MLGCGSPDRFTVPPEWGGRFGSRLRFGRHSLARAPILPPMHQMASRWRASMARACHTRQLVKLQLTPLIFFCPRHFEELMEARFYPTPKIRIHISFMIIFLMRVGVDGGVTEPQTEQDSANEPIRRGLPSALCEDASKARPGQGMLYEALVRTTHFTQLFLNLSQAF